MTAKEVLQELKNYGDESTKNTLLRHGAKEPLFGVKVQDLKNILKKTKKNHNLSLELFDSGNSDAMYLAGLMADETKITEQDLENWVKKASWQMISEYTVPWVAAETTFGFTLGHKWIGADRESVAAAGWSTLANYAMLHQDEDLDLEGYRQLLEKIGNDIHVSPNRVRNAMNNFIIAIGSSVESLTEKAKEIALKIGKVSVNKGDTACKVPSAMEYINKAIDAGKVGKKRQTARC